MQKQYNLRCKIENINFKNCAIKRISKNISSRQRHFEFSKVIIRFTLTRGWSATSSGNGSLAKSIALAAE
jgi:hypothetical protein